PPFAVPGRLAEPDADGKGAAFLAPTDDVADVAAACLGLGASVGHPGAVAVRLLAQRRRHPRPQVLADEFLYALAEHALGGGVGQLNLPLPVDDEDAEHGAL